MMLEPIKPKKPIHQWTPADDELLKKLAADGLSTSLVAKAMGMTKNQIVGRGTRLKVKWHRTVTAAQKRVLREQKAQREAKRAAKAPPAFTAPTVDLYAGVDSRQYVPRSDVKRSLTRKIVLPEDKGCRAPIGDPFLDDFSYCNRPRKAGSSYCPECHGRFYEAPRPRSSKGDGMGLGGKRFVSPGRALRFEDAR
jgi:GcrA cell cycle regulator